MTSILTPSEAQHALQSGCLSNDTIEFINKHIDEGIADAVGHDYATVHIPFSSTGKNKLPMVLKPAVCCRMEQAGYEFIPKESNLILLTFRADLTEKIAIDTGMSALDCLSERLKNYRRLTNQIDRKTCEIRGMINELKSSEND